MVSTVARTGTSCPWMRSVVAPRYVDPVTVPAAPRNVSSATWPPTAPQQFAGAAREVLVAGQGEEGGLHGRPPTPSSGGW